MCEKPEIALKSIFICNHLLFFFAQFQPLWWVHVFLSRPHSPLRTSSRHNSEPQPTLKPAAFISPHLLIDLPIRRSFISVFTLFGDAPLLCPSSSCPAFHTFKLYFNFKNASLACVNIPEMPGRGISKRGFIFPFGVSSLASYWAQTPHREFH